MYEIILKYNTLITLMNWAEKVVNHYRVTNERATPTFCDIRYLRFLLFYFRQYFHIVLINANW